MKIRILALLAVLFSSVLSWAASASSNVSKARENARFLADRMAYELDLSSQQYEDCYEINYDFFYAVWPYLDDMAQGYSDAIDIYYDALDDRNDDIRYVLSAQQFDAFMQAEYFYRPVYTSGSSWGLRIHTIYSNVDFFYYDAPLVFKTYVGAHSRKFHSAGFYVNRYTNIEHHSVSVRIHSSDKFHAVRRSDFGVNVRPRGGSKYDINRYNNRNQKDRTSDSRYRVSRNNQYSPEINHRSVNSGSNKSLSTNNEPRTSTAPSSSSAGSSSSSHSTGGAASGTGNSRRSSSSSTSTSGSSSRSTSGSSSGSSRSSSAGSSSGSSRSR